MLVLFLYHTAIMSGTDYYIFCRGLKSSVRSFHPPQPDLNVDFVVMHFFHYKMSCTLVLSKRVSYDIPTDLSVAIKLEEQHQHSNLVSANMLSI